MQKAHCLHSKCQNCQYWRCGRLQLPQPPQKSLLTMYALCTDFVAPLTKRWRLFPLLLNLDQLCDFLSATEWNRSDVPFSRLVFKEVEHFCSLCCNSTQLTCWISCVGILQNERLCGVELSCLSLDHAGLASSQLTHKLITVTWVSLAKINRVDKLTHRLMSHIK